uniref:Kelch-like protein 17 n=1 Tax=Phallusia mammillata TaxID=59560 RepID=A0A6F9DGN0_9ASCI|nr:kelch-like protein 17 [Phallusia mammillata]
MSKSVLKGIKSLKISHSSWKKLEDSALETKNKLKGIKKLIPNMGNLTSSHHRQHYIENENDYSTELMYKLNELRQNGGSLCDLPVDSEDCLPAHSAVVSFQPALFELLGTMNQTIAVSMENTETVEQSDNTEASQDITDNGLVSHLQVDQLTLENDLTSNKESADDVEEEAGKVKTVEVEKHDNENGQTSETDVADNAPEKENDICDNIAPPLAAELITEKNNEGDVAVNADEIDNMPKNINDPVEVLINFLYTSHVDITQTNAVRIRELAFQCGMDDVVAACDEFDQVLLAETESLATDEEKETARAQFRYRYSEPTLPTKMLRHFNAKRISKQHTDIAVVSESGKVRIDAHSCILACGSNFFQSLITTTERDNEDFVISDIDETVLEQVLDYIYTGRVSVTSHTVADLMRASEKMQLLAIVDGSAEFLESILNVNNCIQHLSVAIEYKHDGLKIACHKFISNHFNAVTRTPDFMTLSVSGLMDILTSNDLELAFPVSLGEMTIYNTVKKWISHDEDNRKQQLEEVMSSVRFPLICERKLVDQVTIDPMVMENENLCKHITEVISSKPMHVFPQPVEMRGADYIVTLGGSCQVDDVTSHELGYSAVAYDNHFTIYDPPTGRFHELALMNETRSLHCVVACEQFLFVVGGFDSYSCITNSVYCFDLSTGTWDTMPNLRVKRACFSLHVVSGYIYAVGGLTPNGYTASVERLDRRKKTWELAASLPDTRYGHAGCVVDGNIIISGGAPKKDSVFSYNPDKNEWNKLPPLNTGRHSHSMVEVKGQPYVLGGDGQPFSIETLQNNKWTVRVPTLANLKLFLPGTAVIGDDIFLLGGWRQENDVSPDIWRFNTKSGVLERKHEMSVPRGSGASCTIRIPSNYWKTKFTSTKMAPN